MIYSVQQKEIKNLHGVPIAIGTERLINLRVLFRI